MNDSQLMETFTNLLGQTIVDIKYLETKFYYNFSGDWSNVNTDLLVLHSPEWELYLSNGQKWYLVNTHAILNSEPIKSGIEIGKTSFSSMNEVPNTVPNLFGWASVLNKKITGVKFYKRLIKNKKFLGFNIGKTYQENIQIVQLFCSSTSFCITVMDGDIGSSTFYPTGYLGNRIGFFFDKTIANSYTVYNITMTMEMIKEVFLENP
ncbi:MAG: hypothetical protein ACOVSR_16480 [Bacteroidia bacterium]